LLSSLAVLRPHPASLVALPFPGYFQEHAKH
jgi:hypothetical protein